MSTEITCAIIGAVSGFLGILAGLPLINWRIAQLEKKVDKHNCLVERTYKLEATVDMLQKEVLHNEKQTC